MDIEQARKAYSEGGPITDVTPGQLLMLVAGGYLDESGDITCLKCGSPNECCECE